jgi:hypothetical protein
MMARFTIPEEEELELEDDNGPFTVTVPADDYYLSLPGSGSPMGANSLLDVIMAQASGWTFDVVEGFVTVDTSGSLYPFSLAASAEMLSLLGFNAAISAASELQTGDLPPCGLWIPDCPLSPMAASYLAKPRRTDLIQTESPSGYVIGHVGNAKYEHQRLRWTHVPRARVWNEGADLRLSLQEFLVDTQWGMGHDWFPVSSPVQVLAHDGKYVGGGSVTGYATVSGWTLLRCAGDHDLARRVSEHWDGYFTVEFPELVSSG